MSKKRAKRRPKVQRACKKCGAEFSATQGDIDRGGGNFCGRKCFHSFKRKSRSVLRLCKTCDTAFSALPSTVANGGGVFCSRKCQGEYKRKTHLGVPRICKTCGSDFRARQRDVDDGKAKFCSKECWVTHKRENNAKVRCTCEMCGKDFQRYQSLVEYGGGRFCSNECSAESRRSNVTCKCKQCGKDFETIPSKARGTKKAKFCSRKCSSKGQGHKKRPPAKRFVCQTCRKVFLEELGRERKYCSNKCCTDSLRKPESQKAERRGKEHAKWALAVLKRDKRCLRCGATGHLQAHHIEHWKACPERRYDLDNGATLCMYCHHAQHPDIPLRKFTELGGVSVRYCVVCESAYVSRKKGQRACGRKCGARLNADGRLRKAAMRRAQA